ncbi:formimidoylglutamase [Metabacillus sp. 84]|uniref:formimidoylglutamase n=1 Tax=unclassified Metabacillus TaxID=2675274 RepID=UPI003CFB4763
MEPFSFLKPGCRAEFKDRYTVKAAETVIPYEKGRKGSTALIGLPYSKSSISYSEAAEAPQTIRTCLNAYTTFSSERNKDYRNQTILDFGDVRVHPTDVTESLDRMHISVKEMILTGSCDRFLILGGDHGVSYPSIRAFKECFGTAGVIQFDAHHDVRNFEDGGKTNGTPFRSLLEEGIIHGHHLVQIGIRDFSNAEVYSNYLKGKNTAVYTMANIETAGIVPILLSELNRLAEETDFIYVSLDMDAVDQAFAPGCPAIGPGGLTDRELMAAVSAVSACEKVIALDIVEIDPSKDFRDMTSRLAAHAAMRFIYR